jgi:uncharacterized protein
MTNVSERSLSEFKPPPGLRNPHIQSLLGASALRHGIIRYAARHFVKGSAARIIECSDARLLCHLTLPPGRPRGLVVALHGWEGCSGSSYILAAGRRLIEEGYVVARLNFRDHGGTQALNEGLFHSCRIGEVVEAVGLLQATFADVPLHLIGFSLGGNFALRVAVRANAAGIALERVVAVCPVLSPVSTMRALEGGLWVYRDYFLRRWRRSLNAKARVFPHLYSFGDLRRFSTLTETTDYFVRQYTEFGTLERYLNGYAIIGDELASLDVPSIIVATRDDPVIPVRDLEDVAQSPALQIALLPHGGHCGLLADYGLRSWLVARLDRLLQGPDY